MPTYTGDWGEPRTITAVSRQLDYYDIGLDGGGSYPLHEKYNFQPAVGDTLRFRIRGLNYILGVKINDTEVFNRSDEEDAELQKEEAAAYEKALKEGYEKNKEKMAKDFSLLPKPFQRKIERLRKNNPEFHWRYEAYEIFVCKETMKIVNTLKTYDRIQKFIAITDPNLLQKIVPNLKYRDHTGNSFEKACKYAISYVTNPKLFHLTHGVMAEIVNCKNYGCLPATDEEIEEALVEE